MCLIKHHIMKNYGGGEVQTHTTLISALAEDKWSTSMTSHFTLQERTPGSCLWENMWPHKNHILCLQLLLC